MISRSINPQSKQILLVNKNYTCYPDKTRLFWLLLKPWSNFDLGLAFKIEEYLDLANYLQKHFTVLTELKIAL